MPDISSYKKFSLGDMTVEYLLHQPSQSIGLRCYPAAMEGQVVKHREKLDYSGAPAYFFEPLVQFKLQGDQTDEYTQGQTMRNSSTLASLRLEEQRVEETPNGELVICTRLSSPRGYPPSTSLAAQRGAGLPGADDLLQPLRPAAHPGNAGQFFAQRHHSLRR
jgi:hypothetical protein